MVCVVKETLQRGWNGMESYEIRPMKPGDEKEIAKVHIDSWKTTYKGIIPASYLDALHLEERTDWWKRLIKEFPLAQNIGRVAVSMKDNRIIGFALGGPAPKEEETDGELFALYLYEECQKQGVGKRLVSSMSEAFLERNWKELIIRALVDNPNMPFYKKLEPKSIRRHTITIDGKDLGEWTMLFSTEDLYHSSRMKQRG